jgi:outer membrane protein TolC
MSASPPRLTGRAQARVLMLAAAMLAGCASAPLPRPSAPELPAAFRGATAAGPSLASRDWRVVFTDSAQQALIEAALAGNLDLQTAQARMREAQAALTAARSGLLPTAALGLNTSPTARRPGESLSSSFLVGGFLSWEIDLWGRLGYAV